MTGPPLASLWSLGVSRLQAASQVTGGRPDAVILAPGEPAAWAGADLAALVARARDLATRRIVVLRLSALPSGHVDAELDALGSAWPDAVLLPACADGRDVQRCGVRLGVREAAAGVPTGRTAIVAELGPAGFWGAGSFRGAGDRLRGLTLDHAGLEAAMGSAPGAFGPGGATGAVIETLLLLAARAAGVPAYAAMSGDAGEDLATACRRARALGFDGGIGRTPEAIEAINAAFARVSGAG